MNRLAPLVLVVLVLLPTTQAAGAPKPEYPDVLVKLLPDWISRAEAIGVNDTSKPWYGEAKTFLDASRAEAGLGHVRGTMYDLETYTELVSAGEVNDSARQLPSDAERKTYAIDRANEWRLEGVQAVHDFRARLAALEPQLHSVQAAEVALYAADNVVNAILNLNAHEETARDFQRSPSFDRGHLLALARADHTAVLNVRWSEDILRAVGTLEGLPPKLVAANWTAVEQLALTSNPYPTTVPPQVTQLEAIRKDVVSTNESIMAIAVNLAESRTERIASINLIYGDAKGRGKDVVGDATRAMHKALNNTTMESARDRGLLGVFTADAIDRIEFLDPFLAKGTATMEVVVSAWASIDHQGYVTQTIGAASPVVPAPKVTKASPVPWVLGISVAAVIAAVAIVVARKRR